MLLDPSSKYSKYIPLKRFAATGIIYAQKIFGGGYFNAWTLSFKSLN